jgi:3-deoxy-D-manno-octulosonic-acid transferase
VGGAFKQGLHNILEPAAFSKPVLFGPLIDKYPEAMEMIKAGAAKIVSDPRDCLESMKMMLDDADYGKRAGTFISERTGATEKVMQLLSNSAR